MKKFLIDRMAIAFLFTVLPASTSIATANTGTCEKTRVTNLHYYCVSPGAACGDGCECKDVIGGNFVKWRDCHCVRTSKRPKGISASISGRWTATVISGAIAPNSTATLELTADAGNELTVYDNFDVGDTGVCPPPVDTPPDPVCHSVDLADSQFLAGPSDFTGTMQLSFGSGPPNDIPVQLIGLDLELGSFDAFYLTFPPGNPVQLPPLPPEPSIGSYDSTTGGIELGPDVFNLIFSAVPMQGELRASIRPAAGGQATAGPAPLDMLVHLSMDFPEGIPATSGVWLVAMALLVAGAGAAVIWRVRTANEA